MQKELFNDSNALKRGICPKDFWDIINEEVGDEFDGKVVRIENYGAFC